MIFSQSCGDIQLKVDVPDDPADVSCIFGAGHSDCFRFGIPVYFKYIGGGTPPASFNACDVEIFGQVLGGQGVAVDYSLSASASCEEIFDFDGTQEGNLFRYSIGNTLTSIPFGTSTDPNFILFIEARPGDEILVNITDVSFKLGSCIGSVCDLDEETSEIIDFDESGQEVTKSAPSACTVASVDINLGTQVDDLVNNHTDVPLNLDLGAGNSATMGEYDVLIVVEDIHGNLDGIEFIQETANYFDVNETIEVSTDLYHIYLATGSVSESFTADTKLGDIRLTHPTATNMEGEAEIYIDYARVYNDTEDECCAPGLSHESGTEKTVTITGDAPCGDYSIDLRYASGASPDINGCANQEIYYDLFLFSSGSTPYTLKTMEVEFEIEVDGNFDIIGVDESEGLVATQCPSDQCPEPTGAVDCYEYTSNTFRFSLCSNTGVSINSDEFALARIILEADSDACLEEITFVRSEIKVGTDPLCAPIYENNTDPFCFPEISGGILDEEDVEVGGVTINFNKSGTTNNCSSVVTFDDNDMGETCDGTYSSCFTCDDVNRIDVVPSKVDDYACGVTTYDMVLMQLHILGITALDSPYKIIAADVNKSGTVSTLDLVAMRKLILLVETTFPGNDSWRFVDPDYEFLNETNPLAEAFPEKIEISLPTSSSEADFIGIKIGDVNLSCDGCDPLGTDEIPDATVINIKAGDDSYAESDTITITFQTDDDYDLMAFQMGLSYNMSKLTYLNTVCNAMPGFFPTQCGVNESKGEIRILTYDSLSLDRSFTDSTTLFEINFIANESIDSLNDIVYMDSTVMLNVAYDSVGTHYSMDFEYVDISEIRELVDSDWKIGFWPNPVDHYFYLSMDDFPGGEYQIEVFNPAGQRLLIRNGERNEGFQKWRFNELSNFSPGIFFLNLSTSSGNRVIKFIKR